MAARRFSFGNRASPKSKLRNLQGKSCMYSYDEIIKGLRKAGFKLAKKEGFNSLRARCQDGKAVWTEENAKREFMGGYVDRNKKVELWFLFIENISSKVYMNSVSHAKH
jgi:hypothetical protein